MTPRGLLSVLVLLSLTATTTSGQEALVHGRTQTFRFAEPGGVGLRNVSVAGLFASVRSPITSWLTLGGHAHRGRASMDASGASASRLSGTVQTGAFAQLSLGGVELRTAYSGGSGTPGLSTAQEVLAGVSATDLLPLPVRSWSAPDGWDVDVILPIRRVRYDLTVEGGIRRTGTVQPFAADPLEYDFGDERHAGIRVGWNFTALTRAELGAVFRDYGTDETGEAGAFEPGSRTVLTLALGFPVRRAGALVRAYLYERSAGSPLGEPSWDPTLVGAVDAPARRLWGGTVEARAPLGPVPIVLGLEGRRSIIEDGKGSGTLLSLAVGSEVAPRGPWPGSLLVEPRAFVHRGRANSGDGYSSGMTGWGLSLRLRWDAPR